MRHSTQQLGNVGDVLYRDRLAPLLSPQVQHVHNPCQFFSDEVPKRSSQHKMNSDTPTDNHVFFSRIFRKLPATARGHVVATLGEFAGTFFFLFFAFSGAQSAAVASNPNEGTSERTVCCENLAAIDCSCECWNRRQTSAHQDCPSDAFAAVIHFVSVRLLTGSQCLDLHAD